MHQGENRKRGDRKQFLCDRMPRFIINFSNRLAKKQQYNITYTAVDNDGRVFWCHSDTLILPPSGHAERNITIDRKHFGVMKLRVELVNITSGARLQKIVPFTLSNHTSDMPLNRKFGVCGHLNRGRGKVEAVIPLMASAGIGNYRGEDLVWNDFEEKKGVYRLTPPMKKLLEYLNKYRIDYLYLMDSGNRFYVQKGDSIYWPPSDSKGYAALEKYIYELVKQTKGQIKYIEVWNEYHNKHMTGKYFRRADVNANLHRAVYRGARAADPTVKIVGIDEDTWGLYQTGMVEKYLQEMKGEKCFDMISLHPYPSDMSPFEFANAERFIGDMRSLLRKYGHNDKMPIMFTELGWSDYSCGGICINRRRIQCGRRLMLRCVT